jgi:hypothetical protein
MARTGITTTTTTTTTNPRRTFLEVLPTREAMYTHFIHTLYTLHVLTAVTIFVVKTNTKLTAVRDIIIRNNRRPENKPMNIVKNFSLINYNLYIEIENKIYFPFLLFINNTLQT